MYTECPSCCTGHGECMVNAFMVNVFVIRDTLMERAIVVSYSLHKITVCAMN